MTPPRPPQKETYRPGTKETYHVGLDLGQKQDYTALAVVQEVPDPDGPRPWAYHVRHMERLPLGTTYPAIVEHVRDVQRREPLASANTRVVVDTTGVGAPVFQEMRRAGVSGLVGVTIHSGDAVSRDGSVYRVPKRDLVSTLQVLFQGGRVRVADGLDYGPVLRHELQSFKAKINLATGHDSYEAWREGDHDDLVLALAMACWFAETYRPRPRIRRPGTVIYPYAGLRY